MQGPIAAAIVAGLAPSAAIAAMRRLEHAGDRAAPAGMGGADHAGLRVGEQDRCAVGGDDAERDVRRGRSPWRRRAGPRRAARAR